MLDQPLPSILTDEQQHSHNQEILTYYIEMTPQRNSLTFSNNYDPSIINSELYLKINFLLEKLKQYPLTGLEKYKKDEGVLNGIGVLTPINHLTDKIDVKFNDSIEIKTTPYSWYLKMTFKEIPNNNTLKEILKDLSLNSTLKYLEINNIIYIDELMIENINNEIIKYNPRSFRQLDDSIKLKIYEILSDEIKSDEIYFIGGEMLFYYKLLKPNKYIFCTDFESIYNDVKINLELNHNLIHLINYDSDELPITESSIQSKFTMIANTSKHGLGRNLTKNILKLNLEKIIIISCNKKSFQRDFDTLKSKYKINKSYVIKTNYEVTIYFLMPVF